MTDNDFETVPTGTMKCLDDKDLEIQRLREEVRDREKTIDWWRERYNNLVGCVGVALSGETIDIDDAIAIYPLSNGAKIVISRIAKLIAEDEIKDKKLALYASACKELLNEHQNVLMKNINVIDAGDTTADPKPE